MDRPEDHPSRVYGGSVATWLGVIAMVIIFVASIVTAAQTETAEIDAKGSAIAARPL